MGDLRLEPLDARHAPALLEMGREFRAAGEAVYDALLEDPAGYFESAAHFADGRGLPADRVPMNGFLLFEGDALVGAARLRHRLLPVLERDGGHLGYEIRPSARGRGLAKVLLGLMLDEARRAGHGRVLLTAAETNVASLAVIRALGGTADGTATSPRSGQTMLRFWIELSGPAGIDVRPEVPADQAAVEALVEEAFGQRGEADLVARLRREAAPILSLVATRDGALAGHVFLSPVTLRPGGALPWAGLGPLAVAPAQQRRGIGARLVRAALESAPGLGWRAVCLVGNPLYYARFGFRRPATDLHYADPALDPAFQGVELESGALAGRSGVVCFHPAFEEAE